MCWGGGGKKDLSRTIQRKVMGQRSKHKVLFGGASARQQGEGIRRENGAKKENKRKRKGWSECDKEPNKGVWENWEDVEELVDEGARRGVRGRGRGRGRGKGRGVYV